MLEVRTLLEVLGLTTRTRVAAFTAELVQVLEGEVQNGPFKDMQLPTESSWGFGDIAPKILGCYELELHRRSSKRSRVLLKW